MTDLHQSKEWANFLTSQGWIVEDLNGAKGCIRKLPLYGSVIKIQRPQTIPPTKTIDKIAQKYRALFVKLEPDVNNKQQKLNHKGFELDKAPNLPTKTLVLDLTKLEEELWKNLSQNARRNIKKGEKAQLSIDCYRYGDTKSDRALKGFHRLLRGAGRRRGFWPPSFEELQSKVNAFQKDVVLFLASHRKEPIAGLLLLTHDKTAYYEHAATSNKGRRLDAPYLLTWEAIKGCRKFSIKRFDFGGIYDPRHHKATKRWQGFTTFKQRFGGREIEYPPPLVKYYHPLIKLLFNIGELVG